MDDTLRAWSQGATGDRTFREISEDFAAFLIPKIWEAEGRKIARVASRLAISPARRFVACSSAPASDSNNKKAGAATSD